MRSVLILERPDAGSRPSHKAGLPSRADTGLVLRSEKPERAVNALQLKEKPSPIVEPLEEAVNNLHISIANQSYLVRKEFDASVFFATPHQAHDLVSSFAATKPLPALKVQLTSRYARKSQQHLAVPDEHTTSHFLKDKFLHHMSLQTFYPVLNHFNAVTWSRVRYPMRIKRVLCAERFERERNVPVRSEVSVEENPSGPRQMTEVTVPLEYISSTALPPSCNVSATLAHKHRQMTGGSSRPWAMLKSCLITRMTLIAFASFPCRDYVWKPKPISGHRIT